MNKIDEKEKDFWDMTKKEKEVHLGKATKAAIARHHAAGRSTVHGDEKGIYEKFPDGSKVYKDEKEPES